MRKPLRLLPLSLCIAIALPAYAADDNENWGLCPLIDAVPSFDDAPAPTGTAEQRAAQPTDIDGGTLQRGSDEQNIVVQDNVRLSRGDQFLGTDKLSYNQESGKYTAEGHVRYQDSSMRLVAEHAEGDQNADQHRIDDVEYQLTSRRGNGGAERIDLNGAKGALHGSTYSTCAPNQRVWELRAHRIDLNTDEGMGVAHNAVLRIGKVPVLYVPWLMFPIDDRRRTGLLFPNIGVSGKNGFDWRQPIYLNLAPNYDATLFPRYMSKRGVAMGGEFRWLYERGSGEVSGNWMPSDDLPSNDRNRYTDYRRSGPELFPIPKDRLPEKNRGEFALKTTHRLDGTWYAAANLAWVSDKYYLQDFSNSLYGQSAISLRSEVGIYGRGRYWDASFTADHNQLADFTLQENSLAYDRLPRATFHWAQPWNKWVETGVDTEAVRFQHEDMKFTPGDPAAPPGLRTAIPGGSRFDIKPYVSLPLEGAAWFIRPKLAWRYTAYELEGDLAQQMANQQADAFVAASNGTVTKTPELVRSFYNKSPTRSLPITSIDAGLYFDRETEIRGDSYIHTLEPRVFYLRAPYRDQNGIPLFDTNPMSFSWGALFRDNRYSGADRQTDANQLTTALTTRLINSEDGRERLAASIGQIQYFDDIRTVIGAETPIKQGKSAWVADVSVSPSDRWTINATYQWDPRLRSEDVATFRARYLFRDTGVVNFAYRYRRNLSAALDAPRDVRDQYEQADFSFLYPINNNWSVVGRYYYSIKDKRPLEQIGGVQWESCCLAVRLIARRYQRNRSEDLNSSLQVEFELKGLGSAGQNTERVLRRAILGYNRDDLYLAPPSPTVSRQNRGNDADDSTLDPTL
ncbi:MULTISPECIES: LPS assembly protein LptD [Lysobacter]|uniref:LPS assembly protein LptD n=1 Tax=Lysobacter TaxID=68 RepID=UPI001F3EFC44|nr:MULTISPECIES: LPS assembly protein LptD [Lysobacter]UJB20362.1 LPS assembly protein LptD [Lysobacter capsici]UJQ30524.1 LPS assembly protein LptD [Lysobacter gummosus]